MDTLSDAHARPESRPERPATTAAAAHPIVRRRDRLRVIAWLQLAVLALLGIGVLFAPAPFLLHHPGAVIDATGHVSGPAVTDPALGEGGRFLLTTQRTTPLRWGGYLWFSAWLPAGARIVRIPPAAPRSHYVSLAAMDQSKDLATAVANCVVHRCDPAPVGVRVVRLTPGSPAARGGLRPGDVIVASTPLPAPRAWANGLSAPMVTSVAGILRSLGFAEEEDAATVDRAVRLDVVRRDTVTRLTIGASGGPLGADLVTAWVAQRSVEVATGNVGGPSTGLMLALTLVDAMTPGDLTGGRRIAGTGTIAADGTAGPIGGVRAKVAGAVRAGAEVFLAPPENVEEARRAAPPSLEVVEVTSLDFVLRWLCGPGDAPAACPSAYPPERRWRT